MATIQSQHKWRFFRSGGFDQVALDSAADLQHLSELDPKLWTVLNCPTTGLEFDCRTLALLDLDGDGQIRVPEILAAVRWSCERVLDAEIMFKAPGLPLSAIDDQDAEGANLKAAALRVLEITGKTEADPLQVTDLADMTLLFSPHHFNGDGVVMAELTSDTELAQLITEIIQTQGGQLDRSGGLGIHGDSLNAFYQQAAAVVDWHAAADPADPLFCPLGDKTVEAVAAFEAVKAKVDDFFVRCQLAAFDNRAAEALNPAVAVYDVLSNKAISSSDKDVAALPLAAIAAGQSLPLGEGINPAWASAMSQFKLLVVDPLVGSKSKSKAGHLTADQWQQICDQLEPWRSWQAAKPDTTLHQLELERLQAIVAGDGKERLEALIAQDLAASTFADNVDAVERLVRYQRDLVTLLRNFVSLSDFYQRKHKAIFQIGTLYLDQRSCELVLKVSDMARHATMAPFSGCYLVYCTCERQGETPLQIVAALTAGDVDELMVPGRNGVFYDSQGRDWRAMVTKVVAQPVSIGQAFWSPYKRVAAFIETQLQKFAASRDKDIEAKTTTGVTAAATPASTPAATAAVAGFDIAKFAGIFAALGLAVGAIGTALAAMIAGLFSLVWWQIPLVMAAVLLLISGPSMLMAFLTLRRRNLGPLLDANGWAVNTRAKINVPFGAALTGLARLPAGAKRSVADPFAEKKRPWGSLLILLLVAVAAAVFWWFKLN
ncbi:hypothetical protein [Rheinheimera soli]|uniref:EF-hand domain-containing protein n=1 Tax=Rheinheimera soli TaxID=443616 RepID=A0ABU1W0I0_9GAMM|nr:hypothetical protein [Rheinheimera soli]MDR7121468.1 hypothetical protein [Rheinheimera soli]